MLRDPGVSSNPVIPIILSAILYSKTGSSNGTCNGTFIKGRESIPCSDPVFIFIYLLETEMP